MGSSKRVDSNRTKVRAGRPVPRRTVFIKGNHEDFEWLNRAASPELLPGLTWLPNGHSLELSSPKGGVLRIGGIGGCYGASDYERTARRLQGYARRHYTHDEVARLASAPRLDILMTHDAPAGIRFEKRGGAHAHVSNAAGLDSLLSKTRPSLCLFGHHHARVNADIAGVRCVGLNCIGRAGNLVALDMDVGSGDWSVRAEFPPVTKKPRECREGCGDVNALEQTTERDIEEAWNCEIDRRAAQLDSGTAETIPRETARARLRRAVQA
jgi:hypothetical protein